MAESVLNRVLNQEIHINLIYKWILNEQNEENQDYNFGCSQGEFLSFFLNFIHEEAVFVDKLNEMPQKVHTPKSINKPEVNRSDLKIKKRPALFTESKKQTLEARITHSTNFDTPIHNKTLEVLLSPDASSPKYKNSFNKSFYEANTSAYMHNSYASPISPIYTKIATQTPKNKIKPTIPQKSSEKTICLGDYITYSKKTSSKKKTNRNLSNLQENVEPQLQDNFKKTRRINPTNLALNKFKDNFAKSGNNFNFIDDNPEILLKNDLISDSQPLKVVQNPFNVIESNFNDDSLTSNDSNINKNIVNDPIINKVDSNCVNDNKNYVNVNTSVIDDFVNDKSVVASICVNKVDLIPHKSDTSVIDDFVNDKSVASICVNKVDLIPHKSDIFVAKVDSKQIKNDLLIKNDDTIIDSKLELSPKMNEINSKLLDEFRIINLKTPQQFGRLNIDPIFNNITNKNELDIFIKLYDFILTNNLILNITSEIYFIISLVLTKQYEYDESISFNDININKTSNSDKCKENYNTSKKIKEIFTSLHNTVYFAIKTLELQLNILKLLDKGCIKMILLNKRFKLLSRQVFEELESIYEEKFEEKLENCSINSGNVCFMSDTDNRENFPSEASFHAFRKQRDLFYEILRIWENSHMNDGWSFALLGGKIRSLLNLHVDSANYRHFCRLFKAQLLSTCIKNNEAEAPNQLSFLSSIPNINNEKLNRLKNRLVTKTCTNGINATPTFPRLQQFYKDFILVAYDHTFNAHLKDALISEILQLNDTKFACNELEEEDNVDQDTKKSFLLCLNSLRLLAKFLGFLEALPYRPENVNVPEKIIRAEIKTRNLIQPNFDLKQIIANSAQNGCLILTIPWICKYLSMLDPIGLRLPYFVEVFYALFNIYFNAKLTQMNYMSLMLLKLNLGWLFELPHFPSELYYFWCTQKQFKPHKSAFNCLDRLEIIDKNVLYETCPYLDEFKKLLQSNSVNNEKITFKHITPITAVQCVMDVNEKRIKLQLEEAFYNAQPMSIRKTVEFVSERIASACVKTICNQMVPHFKLNAFNDFKQMIQQIYQEIASENEQNEEVRKLFKHKIKLKSEQFMHLKIQELLKLCNQEIAKQLDLKIASTIILLLSDEELEQTQKTCISIAMRVTQERVQQWVNAHINTGIFSKEFDGEVLRVLENVSAKDSKSKPIFALPSGGRNMPHDSTKDSAVIVVEKIRDLTVEVLEDMSHIANDRIINLLQTAENSLKSRCDINDCIQILINRLLLDLILLIITHKTENANYSLFMNFISFWKEFLPEIAKDLFNTIISPRNVKILSTTKDAKIAWESFALFLKCLLNNSLLKQTDFNQQSLLIYQHNWDENSLNCLIKCFKNVENIDLNWYKFIITN